MNTGIYCIKNLITGAFYIGSSAHDFNRRWIKHRQDLSAGRHHNIRLQLHWKFYGESNFRFSVLEECLPEKCIEREQYFIDIFDPEYNICRMAGSRLGQVNSPEHRAKISAHHIGKKYALGYKHTLEARAKLRAFHLGRKNTPEAREKMRQAKLGKPGNRLGHKHTPGTLAKMRAANLGGKHTQEHKNKISASMKLFRAKCRAIAGGIS
jgi:group I intron endonuclease